MTLLFLLSSSGFGLFDLPATQASQPASSINVSNGTIFFHTDTEVLGFSSATGSLTSIQNLLTGQFTQLSSNYPLWTIQTGNQTYSYSAVSKTFKYAIVSNSLLTMRWGLSNPTFAVSVTARTNTENGGVDLGINVTNYNPNVTIFQVSFPYIAGFTSLSNSSASDTLVIPKRDGLMIPDFQHSALSTGTARFQYTGSLTMQFYLIYDDGIGGVYVGAQDSGSNYKALETQPTTFGRPGFKVFWELYAPAIYPGNQFVSNYYISIAAFKGKSWEDGAMVYREWALQQWYIRQGPLATRADIPAWFKNIGMLWAVTPPDNNLPSIYSSLQEGYPNQSVLLDLWAWNLWGFDSGYGNYFPPADGAGVLLNSTDQVHQLGGHLIMFFSGDLVDTNSTTNPSFPSTQQYMVITSNGKFYLQGESNGAQMAVPDPTSTWWNTELTNFSVTAVRDYHADGVYLDGMVDQPVVLNYRNAPNITLSGSTWWQGYASILENITSSTRKYNPDTIITTEGESEIFIPYMSGFWDNVNQDNPMKTGIPGAIEIPMFSFVYHEYSISYGTPFQYGITGASYGSPDLFRYTLAKILAFGMVVRPSLPPYVQVSSNDSGFVMSAITMEQRYPTYLRYGSMLPGPLVNGSSANYPLGTAYLTVPALTNGLYQADNGSYALVVSNPTTAVQNATVSFYNGEFGPGVDVLSATICPVGLVGGSCSSFEGANSGKISVPPLTDVIYRVTLALQFPAVTSTTSSTGSAIHTTSTTGVTTPNSSGGFDLLSLVVPAVASVLIVTAVVIAFRANRRRNP